MFLQGKSKELYARRTAQIQCTGIIVSHLFRWVLETCSTYSTDLLFLIYSLHQADVMRECLANICLVSRHLVMRSLGSFALLMLMKILLSRISGICGSPITNHLDNYLGVPSNSNKQNWVQFFLFCETKYKRSTIQNQTHME